MASVAVESPPRRPAVSLLTGGKDQPYAFGLTMALLAADCDLEFVGSDEINPLHLPGADRLRFLNLRGEQSVSAGLGQKMVRVIRYYLRLIAYAAVARPPIFHILWVNKFEWFDQTVLMAWYRVLGKKICFTAHNVNKAKRDGGDSWMNRLALQIHYNFCHHIFVHTSKMKAELMADFKQPEAKVTVIPFGINNVLPLTELTGPAARQRLGLGGTDKVLLFFGNIAPYKGLEFLLAAFEQLAPADSSYRLVIAGRPKGEPEYWAGLQAALARSPVRERILQVIEYVPDAQTEIYFKAADVSVLPYTHVFQSGVLALSYSFGLPVIATDVGSLREEIAEGENGFVCPPGNSAALAAAIQRYFASDLFRQLPRQRPTIQAAAANRYSWSTVSALTLEVYGKLSANHSA